MAGLRIVIASYLGARRSGACGYALLEAQLKIVAALRAPSVDKVMVVVSGSFDAERMQPLLEQAARNPLVELLFRENGGFSYGGWDHAVTQSLLRDDYLGALLPDGGRLLHRVAPVHGTLLPRRPPRLRVPVAV